MWVITFIIALLAPVDTDTPFVMGGASAFSVVVSEDKSNIVISGAFEAGFADAVIKTMTITGITSIQINSPGGLMYEGLKLADFITTAGDVSVTIASGDMCLSACAFAIIGAKEIHICGALGFHRPYIIVTELPQNMKISKLYSDAQQTTTYMLMALQRAGYSNALYYAISLLSDKQTFITFFDSRELEKFKTGGEYDVSVDDLTTDTLLRISGGAMKILMGSNMLQNFCETPLVEAPI